jgi:hypothetical protein
VRPEPYEVDLTRTARRGLAESLPHRSAQLNTI